MAGYTSAQIQDGVVKYLDKELMPMLPETGFQRVLAGTAIAMLIRKYSPMLEVLKENQAMKMLGVVGEDGLYDLATLSEELKKQLPKEGMKVDVPVIGGLTFHSEDVDKLMEYIKSSK